MYVIATVILCDLQGRVDEYEVGADVTLNRYGARYPETYNVSEPEFSAPGCALKYSRLAADPQSGEVFTAGWSEDVAEALLAAYHR